MTEPQDTEYSGKKVVLVIALLVLVLGVGGLLSRHFQLFERLGVIESVPAHTPKKGVVPVEEVDGGGADAGSGGGETDGGGAR